MNRIAFVTGATGGLGRAIVERLARERHDIAIGFHTMEETAASLAEETRSLDVRAIPVHCDVCSEESVARAYEGITATLGAPSIIIANAGINRDGVSWNTGLDTWNEVIGTNLTGTFLTFKHAIPAMRRQGWGRLVAVSSVVARKGIAGTTAYAASKAGILGLVKAIAAETANKGVTCNAIAVGYMSGGMFHTLDAALQQKVVQNIPVGRPGGMDELSGLIAYLCSEDGGYMTGQTLDLNGGLT